MAVRRRRVGISIGLVVLVAATAVGIALFAGLGESSQAQDTADLRTVKAAKTTLVDTDTVTGSLGYDDERTIRATGAGIITSLPTEGSTVSRGQALYRVDNEPVTLLYGAMPLYRDLFEGVDDGTDVKQLEQNLKELGYDPGTVDKHFSAQTTVAVEELQDDLGITETGRITRDRFTVLPGAIRVGAHQAAVGDQAQAAVYSATGTTRVVSIDLDADDEELAVTGAKATVELPDGRSLAATVTRVGTVASADSSGQDGGSADPTISVTLTIDKPEEVGRLTGAPVTVTLTRTAKEHVVTVPVTALVALAEGGYAVRVPDAAAASGSRLAGVQTGMYAGGLVEIKAGLAAGQDVVVPE